MADNNGVQHIAELGFDLSGIAQDFLEVERMLIEQGVKLRDLSKNNWKLDFSTQIDKTALSGVSENLKQGAQNAQALNERVAKLSVTEKDLLRTYTQSAQVQAQIRKYNVDSSGVHSKNAAEIRSGVDEIWKSYQGTQKLNDEERERLGLLNKQLDVLKSEVSVDRSDAVVKTAAPTEQTGLIGRAGQWFGAYQLLHLSKQAAVETVSTMKEVETQMMEISRVMELTESQSDSLRTSLFGVSHDMAREFENTTEIMLRFSQAGYDVAEASTMTKVALLAMNTAELDAANSTDSMVGILKQWKLEASELAVVMDKLNYTADNNAATTQDLVDGLLRSSSAAKNAKFSFDETVGSLVALIEASGRSGKEVGTALNSMIAYTTRDKSLNVFEGMGIKVWADEAKTEMLSVMDIWGQLAALYTSGGEAMVNSLMKNTDMQELFSEEVAHAVGAVDEYNKMLELQAVKQDELNDAERKSLTEQFGTYRRNYMISLLENFEKINEVVQEMGNAEGHSLRENARYMETLGAKTTQLKNSLQELAVQAGEAGLMDLAKGAVDAVTAITRLTKGVGGLVPVLITVSGVLAIIKRESIANGIISAIVPIGSAIKKLQELSISAKDAGGYMKLFKNNLSDIEVTGGLAVGAIGAVVAAISLITMAVNKYKQGQAEARREILAANEQMSSQFQSFQRLTQQYEFLSKITTKTIEEEKEHYELQGKITEALGARAGELRNLTYGTEEYTGALNKLAQKEMEYYRAETATALNAAKSNLEEKAKGNLGFVKDTDKTGIGSSPTANIMINELGDAYQYLTNSLGKFQTASGTFIAPSGGDELIQYYYRLIEARRLLANDNLEETHAYSDLGLAINNLNPLIEEYQNLRIKEFAISHELANGTLSTVESYENLKQSIYDLLDPTERQIADIDKLLSSLYPGLSSAVGETTTALMESGSALDEWSNALTKSADEIKTLQSGISSLETAMQSLADGKGLTLDATLKLLDTYPELASAIHFVGEEWYFEADALEIVRQAKYNEIAAAELSNHIKMLSVGMTEIEKNELYKLVSALEAASTATERQSIADDILRISQRQVADEVNKTTQSVLTQYNLLKTGASRPIVSPGVSYRGNAEAIKAETSARNEKTKAMQNEQKEQQKAIEAEKKALQSGLKEFEKANKAEIDLIKKKQTANEKAQKAVIDGMKKQQKSAEESYKKQRKSMEDRYSAEIKALQDLKNAEKRSDDKDDYQKNRDDLLLERADMEKRTGQGAVERINAINEELAKLEEAENRRLRDNSIDDQISAIEAKKESELNAMDKVWERRKKQFERTVEQQQFLLEQEKERVALEIEGKQLLVEQEKERINLLIEGITAGFEAQKAAADAQIEVANSTGQAAAQAGAVQLEQLYTFRDGVQRTTSEAEQWFSDMYSRVMQYGDEWAMSQIRNNYDVLSTIETVRESLLQLGKDQTTASQLWRHQGSPYAGASSYFSKSHTGSVVARDGLVNVQAGEIIVREDISRGLIRLVEIMNNNMPLARPSVGSANDRAVVISSPLVVIEKQVFSNASDIPKYNNDLDKTVRKILDDMAKG